MERKILGALVQSRKSFEKVHPHLKKEELSPEGSLIYDLICEFYNTDAGASACDVDILVSRCGRVCTSAKLLEVLEPAIKGLATIEVSPENISREILDLKSHNVGMRLASQLAAGKRGDEVNRLIQEYSDLSTASSLDDAVEDEEFTAIGVTDLMKDHLARDNLIEVWPPVLNEHIDGGAKPGHHILVFAPTEMGKTLMVINMVAGFLRQGKKVLYIGNEDPAPDIIMRLMTRITGMNKYEIRDDPEEAQRRLDKRNWGLFTLASLAPGTFFQIQKLVSKHSPEIVVLDQLRNINVDSENRTQALEKAATGARNLAKRNRVLCVSVTQAADSASGKTILDRGDVDSSNVGIPGQCDLMIGIGATREMEEVGQRVLSFPKNKLSGRHAHIPVTFDPSLSRVIAQ